MAIIKDGNGGTAQLGIDDVSKSARVTLYGSDGHEITDHIPTEITVSDVTFVNNDMISSFDASAYSYISFQLKGTWVGTVKVQASNDNGTWADVVIQKTGDLTYPYVIDITDNSLIKIPILAKYLRVRVTSYTSGTLEGNAFAYVHDIHTGQISSVGQVTIASGQKVSIDAGTEYIGDVKVLPTISAPSISHKVISSVGVNATLLQAGPSNIDLLLMVSSAATPRFFKFYDKATVPVVGTDIPKYTFPLAVGASPLSLPMKGLNFVNGLGYAILLSVDDAGTTPFTVNGEVVAMLDYT